MPMRKTPNRLGARDAMEDAIADAIQDVEALALGRAKAVASKVAMAVAQETARAVAPMAPREIKRSTTMSYRFPGKQFSDLVPTRQV